MTISEGRDGRLSSSTPAAIIRSNEISANLAKMASARSRSSFRFDISHVDTPSRNEYQPFVREFERDNLDYVEQLFFFLVRELMPENFVCYVGDKLEISYWKDSWSRSHHLWLRSHTSDGICILVASGTLERVRVPQLLYSTEKSWETMFDQIDLLQLEEALIARFGKL